MTIKREEYTALGDFIKTSFIRDQDAIKVRYPKLNENFLTAFTTKLEQLKVMETADVVSSEQLKTTALLYNEAKALNEELTFLSDYFAGAGMDNTIISRLKKDLRTYNIEGAVLKIESVLQLIASNTPALREEGMAAGFPETLTQYKVSLAALNSQQNQHMNSKKGIYETNGAIYEELYEYIATIADGGKKVFKDKATADEYTIKHIIQRMRAAKRKDDEEGDV